MNSLYRQMQLAWCEKCKVSFYIQIQQIKRCSLQFPTPQTNVIGSPCFGHFKSCSLISNYIQMKPIINYASLFTSKYTFKKFLYSKFFFLGFIYLFSLGMYLIQSRSEGSSQGCYKRQKNQRFIFEKTLISRMDKLTHELITEIIKSRKYNYSYEPLDRFLRVHASVRCNHFSLKNKHNQTLSAMILKQSYTDTCIVYAHGLGSNKLEVLPVAQYFLELGFNVCAFDFSGSGRSEGEHTTYGVRQQDDINAVLAWLDASRQYQRYILWGRSMGGTSILMSQSRNTNQKVQCIVLDSPFSSFERVAIEIASKSSFVPTVLISLLIDPLRREFQRHYPHLNPFDLNILSTAEKIDTKMIIIYSKNDQIISYQHSKQIIRSCKRSPIEIEIEEDHNKQRKKKTYGMIKRYIEDCMDQHDRKAKRSRSKGRGISVTSKQTQKYHKYKTSICSSVLTQKSINAEFIQQPILTEVQITKSSKKPAIIKSILMKTSKAKRVSNLQFTSKQNKQNTRALINFRHRKRKMQNSIIGCFE